MFTEDVIGSSVLVMERIDGICSALSPASTSRRSLLRWECVRSLELVLSERSCLSAIYMRVLSPSFDRNLLYNWKKESNEIISLRQAYLEESMSLRKEADRQAVSDAVNNLMYAINSKIESLAAEEKKRCLNSR